MLLLLRQLLLELEQLLPLTLLDGPVLAGALALLEGVSVERWFELSALFLDARIPISGATQQERGIVHLLKTSTTPITHLPLTARLGRGTGISLAHGAGCSGECGSADRDRECGGTACEGGDGLPDHLERFKRGGSRGKRVRGLRCCFMPAFGATKLIGDELLLAASVAKRLAGALDDVVLS